jgi:uncharacterized protein YbjT (DUF2867 family)
MNEDKSRNILVLGASGLIGRFVTDDLRARGFQVTGIARRFSSSQPTSALDLEMPLLSMDTAALTRLMADHSIDVVVNCLGVLQDAPGHDVGAVHRDFVARLLQAIRASGRAIRLIHISIPGDVAGGHTAFSQTKREAERLIAASGVAYAILRPGFVIAPSAYGGSAMLRALGRSRCSSLRLNRRDRSSRSWSKTYRRPLHGSPAAISGTRPRAPWSGI